MSLPSDDLAFQPFCCACHRGMANNDPEGIVLSCMEYICGRCNQEVTQQQGGKISSCPSCGKRGIKILSLAKLPNNVADKMISSSHAMDTLTKCMPFQINYYKKALKRNEETIAQLLSELGKSKR